MKKYEAVFILDIRKTDDEGAAFAKEIAGLIESLGGKMEATLPMGRRQFTYEIDKRKAGLYFDFLFELDAAKVRDIKEKYKLDERVLRNMIVINDRPADAPSGVIKAALE
ncbi:MAG: 30S ribosomal protein S6 [Victivallaceae bacterium]|nr:30S ribosomal protein S6 [Victivallaceae bacterium]